MAIKTPEHSERLLDQAIAESFPASDPISPAYEASLEPVLPDQNRSREIWKRRLRKARPSLIALGSAAIVALVAVYVLRDRRAVLSNLRDYIPNDLRDVHLRDYIPWKH
jgi:hypothetical protein